MRTDESKLERAVAALKSDQSLLDCVLEMIDTANDKQNLKTGDDAEDAVVDVIQRAGSLLLQKWADKKRKQAEERASIELHIRPHEKKRSAGTHLSEIST